MRVAVRGGNLWASAGLFEVHAQAHTVQTKSKSFKMLGPGLDGSGLRLGLGFLKLIIKYYFKK